MLLLLLMVLIDADVSVLHPGNDCMRGYEKKQIRRGSRRLRVYLVIYLVHIY